MFLAEINYETAHQLNELGVLHKKTSYSDTICFNNDLELEIYRQEKSFIIEHKDKNSGVTRYYLSPTKAIKHNLPFYKVKDGKEFLTIEYRRFSQKLGK